MGTTTRLLGQLRGAVQVEVEADAALPRDLEFRLFGFYDELVNSARARQHSRRAAQRPVAPAATAPQNSAPQDVDADEATG